MKAEVALLKKTQSNSSVINTMSVVNPVSISNSRIHPGRIGAVANGISRSGRNEREIIWANNASETETKGYTWVNFRLGWRDPLEKVYGSSEDCGSAGNLKAAMWTCCKGLWNSPPCSN